jgi:hypothetical protein
MEARRNRSAAAPGVGVGGWALIAAAAAIGLTAAHRTVESSATRVELAERLFDVGTDVESSIARPPITASISTIVACATEEILLDRCRFAWRSPSPMAFARPDLRIEGRARSSDAVGRFADRLATHPFLGEAVITSLTPHGEGGVSFELAVGDESDPVATSIVAEGDQR